jgi:outer membrane protein assembly factor BamD
MWFRILPVFLAVMAALQLPAISQTQTEDEPEPASQRRQVNPNITPAEQVAFDQAVSIDTSSSPSRAISAYRRFIRDNPASPLAMKAQYRIAEIYEYLGDANKAFSNYQTLLTQYPDTPDFEKAVGRQVTIANMYLGGRKLKFLGLAIVPSTDRAEEMFTSIIQNAPYSKNAPVAQFNLGLTYERQGRVKEAAAAYQAVLDNYPNSAVADDALYQIGYIYKRLGDSGRSQDLSAVITSKNTFEDFLLQFPNNEKSPQARDNIGVLSAQETDDLMDIARYYDRFKNYRAAAIYYNDVIRRAPGSADANAAEARMQELRAELGEDALRTGPEQAETGEKAAIRRRLQAQVETSALADFNGPPRRDVVSDELPVVNKPRLRTGTRDVAPMPAVEPVLPAP